MSDFKREERYTVVKHKDISDAQLKRLRSYLATNGMPTRTGVVVEPDWPIYGLVWQMIESLSNGKVPIDPKVLAADLNAALEREQALAAHVECLHNALDNVLAEIVSESDGGLSDMVREGLLALDEDVDASTLNHRDAIKQADVLDRLSKLLKETHFDKAPSVARVVMQVNDAINRVKQEVRPIRLVSQSQSNSDPHPDCELECGAYGTYCKCAAEAQQ